MNEKTKFLVTLGAIFGILLLMLVGFYFQLARYGWGPFIGKYNPKGKNSLQAEIAELNKRMQKADADIAQIVPLQDAIKAMEPDKKVAEQLLPNVITADQIADAIREKAKSSGVFPKRVNARKPSGGGRFGGVSEDFEEWDYSIEVTGTYNQIGTFINKMEEFEVAGEGGKMQRRFFAVKEVDVKPGSSATLFDGAEHKCSIVMLTFKYTGEE